MMAGLPFSVWSELQVGNWHRFNYDDSMSNVRYITSKLHHLSASSAGPARLAQSGWKAKACTSFVLYLKVFKNHLYYLWHVRVLSIKSYLHTQLPEHNKSYRKVSQGGGIWSPGMDLWWGIWTAFRPREGEIWTKIFQKFKCPGVARGDV